jgi:ABC-type polysaccharide/polyol phosphate transport system ATPase subunit
MVQHGESVEIPEILLKDEWITAGRVSFLAKAQRRVHRSWRKRASWSAVAQHRDLPSILQTGIWMDQGKIKIAGPIDDVLDA